jgi:hypothetical protein
MVQHEGLAKCQHYGLGLPILQSHKPNKLLWFIIYLVNAIAIAAKKKWNKAFCRKKITQMTNKHTLFNHTHYSMNTNQVEIPFFTY